MKNLHDNSSVLLVRLFGNLKVLTSSKTHEASWSRGLSPSLFLVQSAEQTVNLLELVNRFAKYECFATNNLDRQV